MSHEPAIVGKEAIRTLYQYVFENYSFSSDENYTRMIDVEEMEVEIDGDLGYIWSSRMATVSLSIPVSWESFLAATPATVAPTTR